MLVAQTPGVWITSGPAGTSPRINVLVADPNQAALVYAGTQGKGIFRSMDFGLTWQASDAPLNTQEVTSMLSAGDILYVGTVTSGIFRSMDTGSTWRQAGAPLHDKSIRALLAVAETLYVGTEQDGVFRSADQGLSWSQAAPPMQNKRVTLLQTVKNRLYAGTWHDGLFWSHDAGQSWEHANPPMTDKRVQTLLAANDTTLFAGTILAADPRIYGFYLSQNGGKNWEQAPPPLGTSDVRALLYWRGIVYAGTDSGVFFSAESGKTWHQANSLMQDKRVNILVGVDTVLYAGLDDDGVYRSLDGGVHWQPANAPMRDQRTTTLLAAGNVLYAGTDSAGVFRSTDAGKNWYEAYKFNHANLRGVLLDLNLVFAYGDAGVFQSRDGGPTWTKSLVLPKEQTVVTMLSANGVVYAGTKNLLGDAPAGIFYSSDGGAIWKQAEAPMNDKEVTALLAVGDTLVLAGTGTAPDLAYGLYFSTDGGRSWGHARAPMADKHVTALLAGHGRIYAGTGIPSSFIRDPNGVFFSRDNGMSWTQASAPMQNKHVTALLAREDKLFAGVGAGFVQVDRRELGVFYSLNRGQDWQQAQVPMQNKEVTTLLSAFGRLYAGTKSDGLFYSTDEGVHWQQSDPPLHDKHITSLLATTTALYAGTAQAGTFRSRADVQWTPLDFGMGKRTITQLAYLPQLQRLFAATEDGVYYQTIDLASPRATSLEINNGAHYTSKPEVSLLLVAGAADSMNIAEDSSFTANATGWQEYQFLTDFLLSRDDGLKNIYARLKDRSWNESETISAQIVLDVHAPVFLPSQPLAPAAVGRNVSITQQIMEPNLDKIKFYYRVGNRPWREDQSIQTRETVAQFAGALITSQGFDFRIVAFDLAGNADTLQNGNLDFFSLPIKLEAGEAGSSPDLPAGDRVTDYRLVSLPVKLHGAASVISALGDLGEYGANGDWRFWTLQPHGQWQEGPNLPLKDGQGYFLILRHGGTFTNQIAGETMETTAGVLGTIAGWHLRANDWTLIGNPYNFNIEFGQLQLARRGLRLDQPDTSFQVWAYNQNGWIKESLLEPWRGLAIYCADEPDTILFADPGNSFATRLTKPRSSFFETGANLQAGEWIVRVRAESEAGLDRENYFGVRKGAIPDQDLYDWHEPPMLPGGISLRFPHPEWRQAGSFASDIRPFTRSGLQWRIEVKANGGHAVKLTFDDLETVPEELEVWLADEALQIVQNLRERKGYTVVSSEHPKNLKLVVGKMDFIQEKLAQAQLIPARYELSQNFPNPFNPVTTIRYGVPSAQRVTLKVYNLLGEEVATLMHDEHKAAGYHVAIWDGRNQAGRMVTSGVYVYRLQAGQITMTKKMALIR